jgi:hypothetical protein
VGLDVGELAARLVEPGERAGPVLLVGELGRGLGGLESRSWSAAASFAATAS